MRVPSESIFGSYKKNYEDFPKIFISLDLFKE